MKDFISFHSLSLREVWAGTWGQDLKDGPKRGAWITGLLPMACFIIPPMTILPGLVLLTVNSAFLYQS